MEVGTKSGTLADRIDAWPLAPECGSLRQDVEALISEARALPELAALAERLQTEPVASLIDGVMAGSPYLKGLIRRDLARLDRILVANPEPYFDGLVQDLRSALAATTEMAGAMRLVRVFKSEVALLTALADLGGVWPVLKVTSILTETADAALTGSIEFLFRSAAARGDWLPPEGAQTTFSETSGYFVLGMGKYGAFELNYSSDIDLIVFYDPERARLKEGVEAQTFFVRLTKDLVRLMDERTSDGYVFRTDLRLRPDAGATQVAMSTDAAMIYYESFGQNWERAALIKARTVAGDIEAGDQLLADLAPFIWRRYLDFATISDIHAMKRQIHAFRGLGGIGVAGHNVKLGRGGIREVEFFAQTQQLIAGGRQKDLRVRRTLDALQALMDRGWIKDSVCADLEGAYLYLRAIEHRIQMVADEQTHELPDAAGRLHQFARFAGYERSEDFSKELVAVLETVQRHYGELFENVPELTVSGANMVFAGEDDDPGTVEALTKMGYSQPCQLLATVRGWHHGRYPAVRTERARERLTEVQPLLIQALAETADPDSAFASFDRFLAELPSGVQLFSLLRANPGLLRLVSDIMGTAPRLARVLSKRRRLLDAVLDPRILTTLPSAQDIDALIASEFSTCGDQQETLDRARVIGSEQSFLIGVRVLSGAINASQAGGVYALVAERLIGALQAAVEDDLVRAHGRVPGGEAVVVAMGKLGGREMTASSDLDLIVVYDFDEVALQSDGARPLAPSQYYSRMTQRLITALSAPTAEGTLYDVDMRLRPSGQKGPVATQLSSFIEYQANEAWTWEHMALVRARVVSGPAALTAKVEEAIRATLLRRRDRAKIAQDVREMRQRIVAEKGTDVIWDLKQVRGGIVDQEFIVQYLQLVHAADYPEILDRNTVQALHKLSAAKILPDAAAVELIATTRLLHDLTQVLRLCLEGQFDPSKAPKGLKELAARAGDAPTFEALEVKLRQSLATSADLFDLLIV